MKVLSVVYNRAIIRPLFGEHVLLLLKHNLSTEDIAKCPNVLLFGILSSKNMFNHAYSVQMYHHISKYWRPLFLLFICC